MDRFTRNALFWLVIPFILWGTVACRVQIGLGQAAAQTQGPTAPAEVNSNAPVALPTLAAAQPPVAPASSLTAEVSPSATPLPTAVSNTSPQVDPGLESLVAPVPSPTPTPQPLIPAQSPPARLLIPAINLDTPVEIVSWSVIKQAGTETTVWDVPENAAGWHRNSALPGHGGNIVFSGHHNLGTEVFRYLVDLKKGDEIILQADGRDYRYQVVDRFILPERGVSEAQRQQNAQWIMPTIDERLTLVTCWPYNDNSHRLIVVAK